METGKKVQIVEILFVSLEGVRDSVSDSDRVKHYAGGLFPILVGIRAHKMVFCIPFLSYSYFHTMNPLVFE